MPKAPAPSRARTANRPIWAGNSPRAGGTGCLAAVGREAADGAEVGPESEAEGARCPAPFAATLPAGALRMNLWRQWEQRTVRPSKWSGTVATLPQAGFGH